MAFLEAHGCDHIQGYYVSPPLTPSEMFEYLTRLS
jgi:EAL domain-containing protein (putative c-di-GMP-specific phosphodiesterase class I)